MMSNSTELSPYRALAEVPPDINPYPKLGGGFLIRKIVDPPRHRCPSPGFFKVLFNRVKKYDFWVCAECKKTYTYHGWPEGWIGGCRDTSEYRDRYLKARDLVNPFIEPEPSSSTSDNTFVPMGEPTSYMDSNTARQIVGGKVSVVKLEDALAVPGVPPLEKPYRRGPRVKK